MRIVYDFSGCNANEIMESIKKSIGAENVMKMGDALIDLTASPPTGTPVDTGAARNDWQIDDSDPLACELYNTSPYIKRLNEGHSKQSPAGFVDRVVDKHFPK